MTDEPKKTSDIVKEALKRFKTADEAYKDSRRLAIIDTKFAWGDSDNMAQWPESVATSRNDDKKVCLTINHVAQHCNQIINGIRQNRPTGKVIPANDSAHKKSAEIYGGLIRSIQASSNADDSHDTAAEHAIYGGFGYWRVITEYESPDSFNQVIRIRPCPNPQLVYVDPIPSLLEPEKREWGFIFEDVLRETFKREHPDIDPESWEIDSDGWVSEETFRRAEYFYSEYVDDTVFLLQDGTTALLSTLNGVKPEGVVKERKTQRREWHWCILVGGHNEPLEEKIWAGEYLPIIETIGKAINIDGKMTIKGETRDLKDQQRMINYAFSETVQTLALQNKIPYMAATEAIEGYEDEWAAANTSNAAYLPWNSYDEAGNQIPMPSRQMPPVMASAQVQLLQAASEQMRAASGQQNANFGIKSEAASGIGIQRLRDAGEVATFHFPDNHARGLRYELKILVDLIPKILDTRQVVTILGIDGKQDKAILDPNHHESFTEINSEDIQRIFNPTIGKYDVAIDTGPSYTTQRQEGAASLNELAGRNPALMQVAGDLIMRAQDFPMADELADRLAKTLPAGLQDKKTGAEEQLAQMSQQFQQMQQQMQMMGQALQEAHQKLQEAESGQQKIALEYQSKQQIAQADAQLQAEKLQRETEARQQQAVIDAQLMREKADIEASISLDKARQDAAIKMEIAKLDNETKEDIAELNAYVELEKAKIAPPPALTNEVNTDLAEETPLPKIMRRRIQMQAPSGQMYTGMVEDMPQDQTNDQGMM